MGARIHLIFKRTRILKYLVFRWRLRRRVEKKQYNVRILRSVLATTLEHGKIIRLFSTLKFVRPFTSHASLVPSCIAP